MNGQALISRIRGALKVPVRKYAGHRTLEAVIATVETLLRMRGDIGESAVRVSDLPAILQQLTDYQGGGSGGSGGSGGVAGLSLVTKQASEVRSNTTSLTADAELIAPLAANTKYRVRGVVYMRASNAAMDIKYALQYSGVVSDIAATVQRHVAAGESTETIIGT